MCFQGPDRAMPNGCWAAQSGHTEIWKADLDRGGHLRCLAFRLGPVGFRVSFVVAHLCQLHTTE